MPLRPRWGGWPLSPPSTAWPPSFARTRLSPGHCAFFQDGAGSRRRAQHRAGSGQMPLTEWRQLLFARLLARGQTVSCLARHPPVGPRPIYNKTPVLTMAPRPPPMCLGPSPHPVLPLCSSLTIQEASGPPDVPRTLCLGAFAFAVAAVSKALFAGSCTPQVRSLSARLCSNVPSVQTRGLPCPLPFTLTPLFFCTAMPICVPEAWRQPAGAWEVFTDYANSLLNISSAYVIPLRSIVLFSHLTGKPRHREAK